MHLHRRRLLENAVGLEGTVLQVRNRKTAHIRATDRDRTRRWDHDYLKRFGII